MSAEGRRWQAYAQENRRAATVCLKSDLFNPCLQNAQQAVEKTLKALHLAHGLPLKKTHSIGELRGDLLRV
jgi:HEPN domain-containing protein